MKGLVKQGITQIFAQIGICALICGATIGILFSSGLLLLVADEGRRRSFLLPILGALAITVYLSIINERSCHQRGLPATKNKMLSMMLFMLLSGLISLLITIYVFIPWWIPDYKGGLLLP